MGSLGVGGEGGAKREMEVFFSPGRLLGPRVSPGSSQVTPETHFSGFWNDVGSMLELFLMVFIIIIILVIIIIILDIIINSSINIKQRIK